jgi:hypothetical protein
LCRTFGRQFGRAEDFPQAISLAKLHVRSFAHFPALDSWPAVWGQFAGQAKAVMQNTRAAAPEEVLLLDQQQQQNKYMMHTTPSEVDLGV